MVIFHSVSYVYQRIVSRNRFQLRVAHDSPRRAELVLFCCDTNPFNWRSFVMGFCCRPSMPGRLRDVGPVGRIADFKSNQIHLKLVVEPNKYWLVVTGT